MATSALARKVGGLCIEGCIRDSAEIIEAGFPIFATGFCIRGTGKGTLGLVNYPLIFGGITVHPGDLVVGDDDGLVLVRRDDAADVLKKTEERVAREIEKARVLSTGVSSVEYNQFGPLFEAAGLVEEQAGSNED
jgi:4-hydroxy-4-methyl-2-oxoglutarate aldolase